MRLPWRSVGGYPPQSLNEDAVFFRRIHETLNQSFVAHPLNRNDRFFLLRGKSKYKHMCMKGGESPLDLTPGHYELKPSPIADTVLRQRVDQLVEARKPFISI
ncbi:hypothetical protein DTL42_11305 [Bremerella cremea]|uniref:Uncharacterized protein n=1 Tax=Bremerella cremea TaxID=1031537 RepID=A0A368KQJ7_9BACT|nr:hypothetical protein [Bremerella cremea]RCS49123.1 hypothetical protein DTL42_11305 [Bremerella cremea]